MNFPNSIDECITQMLKIEPNIKIGSKLLIGDCICLCETSELKVVEITRTYNQIGYVYYFVLYGEKIKNQNECNPISKTFILIMDFTDKQPQFSIIRQGHMCDCYNKYCHSECRYCDLIWHTRSRIQWPHKKPSTKKWKVEFGKCKHSEGFKLLFQP